MDDKRPELILIRHAPVAIPGVLAGRSDLPARIESDAVARTRALLPPVAGVLASPAQRCTATAAALFPGQTIQTDPALWEQDFGTFDGQPLTDLPDLGPLSPQALADHRWPGGESFSDLCARVAAPLLAAATQAEATGKIALVVHAGVIRAALALTTGHVPGALAFEIAPLSVTRLGVYQGRPVSIRLVNGGGT